MAVTPRKVSKPMLSTYISKCSSTWVPLTRLIHTEKTFACMKAAYDAGVNFFDCAEGYAGKKGPIFPVAGSAVLADRKSYRGKVGASDGRGHQEIRLET